MASYKVQILETAVDELRATPFPFRRQINQRLMRFRSNPLPPGSEMVAEGRYRLGVGDWWILYSLDEGSELVTVVGILRADRA